MKEKIGARKEEKENICTRKTRERGWELYLSSPSTVGQGD